MAQAVTLAAASDGSLAALPLSILATDPGGYPIFGWLIANAITGVVAGLVSAMVCIAAMRIRLKNVEDNVREMQTSIAFQGIQISEQAVDRAKCELRASQTYCTREELMKSNLDTGKQIRELGDKVEKGFDAVYQVLRQEVGKVHKRVNLLAPEAKAQA